MRNRFLYKALKVLGIAAVVFAVASCKNAAEPENQTPVLKISVASQDRTVLPDALEDFSVLSDIELYGSVLGGTSEKIATFANVDALEQTSVELPVENPEDAIGQTWIFELVAKAGNLNYAGACARTITKGPNKLNITLVLQNLGEENQNGSLKLTLDYSKAANANKVTKVEVSIWEYVSGGYATTNPTNFNLTDSDNDGKVVLETDVLHAGSYAGYIKFYSKDAIILQWTEDIQIAEGLLSSKEITIENLNDVIDVTYELNNGTDNTVQFTGISAISRFNKTEKVPVPSSYKAIFLGWYADKDLTDSFGADYSAAYTAGKDITLYAKWYPLNPDSNGVYTVPVELACKAFFVLDSGTVTNPKKIKVTGSVTSAALEEMNATLGNTGGYYGLDLSAAEGLTEIPSNCFYNNDYLVSIVLPEGLKTINGTAFLYTRNLSSVNIPSTVETIGGSAFLGCALTEFIIPDSVTYIGSCALQDNYSLSKLEIGAGLKDYELFITGDSSLSTIVLSSQNPNFKQTSDGVVFTKDGKRMLAFPYGTYTGTYEVPEELEVIEYYLFHAANKLTGVKFADDGGTWYYNKNSYSIPAGSSEVDKTILMMQNYTALDNSKDKYASNLLTLKNGIGWSFYKITATQKEAAWAQYFNPQATFDVSKYECLDVRDGSFIHTSNANGVRNYIRFRTKPGTTYYVNWVDCNSCNNGDTYNNYNSSDYSDCKAYVYNGNFASLLKNYENGYVNDAFTFSFTADTNATFIGVQALTDGNSYNCAFRVWEKVPAQAALKITVAQASDITVNYSKNYKDDGSVDYIYFYKNDGNNYDSYAWYINGVEDTNYTNWDNYSFYPSNYTDKVNTITLEAEKNGIGYSYTAIVECE